MKTSEWRGKRKKRYNKSDCNKKINKEETEVDTFDDGGRGVGSVAFSTLSSSLFWDVTQL